MLMCYTFGLYPPGGLASLGGLGSFGDGGSLRAGLQSDARSVIDRGVVYRLNKSHTRDRVVMFYSTSLTL